MAVGVVGVGAVFALPDAVVPEDGGGTLLDDGREGGPASSG